MKLVYQFRVYQDKKTFIKIMDMVIPYSTIVKERKDIDDYIYIEYNKNIYEFYRYCPLFIKKIEEIENNKPIEYNYDGTYGHFHVFEIDDRFCNKKYYKIRQLNNEKTQEDVIILKDKIIEDLYNCHSLK